jgi:hypothetical protein
MSRRVTPRRRVAAALLALALAAVAVIAAALSAGDSVAQQGAAPLRFEGWGAATGGRLIGAAPLAGAGQLWGVDASGTGAQTFLTRWERGGSWQRGPAPLDEQGAPYTIATWRDGRVTPRGGLLIVSDDAARPENQRRVVLVGEPGAAPRVLPAPPAAVLRPQERSLPAETLSERALGVRDGAAGTEAFLGIVGRPQQTAIARWGEGVWTREPICVADASAAPPAGCSADETLADSADALEVVALTAVDGAAWALARADRAAGRGLVLFERTIDGGTPRWILHELPAPLFAAAATPARAVDAVAPLATGRALTATSGSLWIDATFRFRGVAESATIRLAGAAATTWCDAADDGGPLCDHPLGFDLSPEAQSYAWDDPAPNGARVVATVGSGGGPRSSYASLEGDEFVLRPAFATDAAGAFLAPDEGWIGPVRVTRDPWAPPLANWSIPVRRPLTAIAGEPGKAPGDIAAQALAVGMRGTILRYAPGQGWDSEGLIAAGGVATPNLRGVAWPSSDFAYAVGDEGAMWRWSRITGLWEPDPAAPFDFVGHLTGVAFQPGNPDRGFAVGRGGALLRYGKTWEREALPPEVGSGGPLGGPADLTSVAFAGGQALVAAGGHLLVEDGAGWRVDAGAQALIDSTGGSVVAVAGLPDGGAVAAGRDLVLERDSATAPWRVSDQPIGGGVIAAAALREDGRVRALLSVGGQYPLDQDVRIPVVDPNAPPPRLPPLTLPGDGTLVRETAAGWRDEQRGALRSPGPDTAFKSDPVVALLTDAAGRGWTVGGWNSVRDIVGRGVDVTQEPTIASLETASVARYDPAGPQPSANVRPAAVPTASGPVRLAVGGGARCRAACAALSPLSIGPDRTLSRALAVAGQLHGQPGGPRAFLYTGGRAAAAGPVEQQRFAELLGAAPLPVLPALASGEAPAGDSLAFQRAFAGFAAPLGAGAAPAGMTPVAIGAPPQADAARTHFAVDSGGPEGTVRIVVIDNAAGSLASSGNPAEDQVAWLRAVLADARDRGLVTIVVGNRPLSPREPNAASDADQVAGLLRDGGASAYLYEGDREQRATVVPAGTGGVPAFSSGTLGYRDPLKVTTGYDATGILVLELDAGGRDPATNRAPVRVRLVPVLDDLALEAVDGRVLNRSQPALFRGLGRRPRSGDLEDNYVALPNAPCVQGAQCPDRIDPEVRFASSDPDIAQFVRIDRTSANPRKPYVDPATDKVVADAGSGLLCAFNAGTTTVTIESGGLSYTTTVTVRDGSVLRPCGTMPLDPRRFPRAPPSRPLATVPPPPAEQAPPEETPAEIVPPPPPARPDPVAPPVVEPRPVASVEPRPQPPRPLPRPQPPVEPDPVPAAVAVPALVPLAPLPPPPSVARPIPPSGTAPVSINVPVAQPVAQIERQREEEEALEQSSAYMRVSADHDPGRVAAPLLALVLLAALGGVALRRPRRDRSLAYVDDRSRRYHR